MRMINFDDVDNEIIMQRFQNMKNVEECWLHQFDYLVLHLRFVSTQHGYNPKHEEPK